MTLREKLTVQSNTDTTVPLSFKHKHVWQSQGGCNIQQSAAAGVRRKPVMDDGLTSLVGTACVSLTGSHFVSCFLRLKSYDPDQHRRRASLSNSGFPT